MNTPLTVIQRTITYSPQVAAIRTWEDGISLGVIYAEDRDRLSWAIGELASFLRSSSVSGGRPTTDKKLSTLSAIADSLHMRREAVSSMCANFEFYFHVRARLPENCSWHDLSEARRDSGWRPGMDITNEHVEHALQFAEQAADKTTSRPRRTLAASLAAERERLAALAGRDEASPSVKRNLLKADVFISEAIDILIGTEK